METQASGSIRYIPLAISVLITLAIGIAASLFTEPEIESWYVTIKKPSFTPPDWVFAPVWTIIYILIGVSAYLVWRNRDRSAAYRIAVILYIIQLLLNFSWTIVFFGMHNIFEGLLVIKLLWISIVFNIIYFGKFSKISSLLMVPYLLWVSFATALNLGIFLLNR